MISMTRVMSGVFAVATLAAFGLPTLAQAPPAAVPASPPIASPPSAGVMKKLSGVWIEGPGYDITYGGNYDGCAKRCLADSACKMIEYYRPEKKCNLYKETRPQKPGGSSDVGIRG